MQPLKHQDPDPFVEEAKALTKSVISKRTLAKTPDVFSIALRLLRGGVKAPAIERAILDARGITDAAVDYQLSIARDERKVIPIGPHVETKWLSEIQDHREPDDTGAIATEEEVADWFGQMREQLASGSAALVRAASKQGQPTAT